MIEEDLKQIKEKLSGIETALKVLIELNKPPEAKRTTEEVNEKRDRNYLGKQHRSVCCDAAIEKYPIESKQWKCVKCKKDCETHFIDWKARKYKDNKEEKKKGYKGYSGEFPVA